MKDNKSIIILFMVIASVLGGVGQLLFKYAFIDGKLGVTLLAGIGVYALSTALYFYVLSRTHLSWTNALSGISYVLAVVFASTILGENVSFLRWIGVIVIVVGVVLVSMT